MTTIFCNDKFMISDKRLTTVSNRGSRIDYGFQREKILVTDLVAVDKEKEKRKLTRNIKA